MIQFNSVTDALFADLQPWNGDTLRQAQAYVAALVATGGTEMRPALRLALAGETPAGRLKQIVFLTDAAVGNEAEMFEDIARQLGDQRLFTIGIGAAPNSYFMRKAAELGRGSFSYIGDVSRGRRAHERAAAQAGGAGGHRHRRALAGGGGGRAPRCIRPTVPDLYDGQPVTFSARHSERDAGRAERPAGDRGARGRGGLAPGTRSRAICARGPASPRCGRAPS